MGLEKVGTKFRGRGTSNWTLLLHIQHGMLWFCGFQVLAPVVSSVSMCGMAEDWHQQLGQVRDVFMALDSRLIIFGEHNGTRFIAPVKVLQDGSFQRRLKPSCALA